MRIRIAGVGLLAALLLVLSVTSSFAAVQSFRLHDHPDGRAQPPLYGFRLDELLSPSGDYTFSFDHSLAKMFLDYDDTGAPSTIHIYGKAFGGLVDHNAGDWDSDYSTLWDIDFTYSANVQLDPGGNGDDFIVNPDDPGNNGTITAAVATSSIALGESYNLVDFNGNPTKGFSFKFNDIDQHRLSSGVDNDGPFVGWGWVNHSDGDHINASDWLFTAEAIPEPTTLVIWSLLATLGLSFYRRRRRRAA